MASNTIDQLEKIIRSEDDIPPHRAAELSDMLDQPPIQDVVALVERSTNTRAAVVLRLLSRQRSIAVFDALDAAHQADLIGALQGTEVYSFFGELDPDDRVSLLDELPAEIADQLLRNLDPTERDVTGVVLGYPKGSIGRRMSPEVPIVYADMTVEQTLRYLRSAADDVETIYLLPVIDRDRTLLGVISLRKLFNADDENEIRGLMNKPIFANAHDGAEETARWFMPLDLLAMPIVDDSSRLVGILTFDDAQDILEEADDEDTARSGAHEPLQQPYLSTPLLKVVRSRVVWLLVLAVSALLTVQVLDAFEETLAAAVVLSLFIPLLTGTGGNTGNQAATTVTRALALGDVRKLSLIHI